jgi:hypothetical protein
MIPCERYRRVRRLYLALCVLVVADGLEVALTLAVPVLSRWAPIQAALLFVAAGALVFLLAEVTQR